MPAVLNAGKHCTSHSNIAPYFGVGPTYAFAFDTSDSALKDIDVDNAFGALISPDAQVPETRNFGGFIDVEKIFLKTQAMFDASAGPGGAFNLGRAGMALDPVLITVDASCRF